MSGQWKGSTRRSRLPPNWPELRAAAFKRDGWRCTVVEAGRRCVVLATDCDHVVPNDDHSLLNLTSLCSGHHANKSSREGNAAKAARKAAILRPREQHPGML